MLSTAAGSKKIALDYHYIAILASVDAKHDSRPVLVEIRIVAIHVRAVGSAEYSVSGLVQYEPGEAVCVNVQWSEKKLKDFLLSNDHYST